MSSERGKLVGRTAVGLQGQVLHCFDEGGCKDRF